MKYGTVLALAALAWLINRTASGTMWLADKLATHANRLARRAATLAGMNL